MTQKCAANYVEHPLCLCEYYNSKNQRAHMLTCCCNCEAFDSLCTLCLCCNNEETEKSKMYLFIETLNDMSDRCRVPCPGGARKLNADFLLAFVSICFYIKFGTTNFLCSLITIFLLPFMLYIRFFTQRLKATKTKSNLN